MTATILDGRALAKELQREIQQEVESLVSEHGVTPHLAVVQVEGDEASERYVRSIRKRCDTVGIGFHLETLAADVSQHALNEVIQVLSNDTAIHGVLIQMPLPKPLSAEQAVLHLNYAKDVDGIHPINAGLLAQGRSSLVPNTPAGGMVLLQRYDITLAHRHAAVVGRSPIVGRPLAALLLHANATVTICHSYTTDLAKVLRECDVVLVATGRPGLITGDMIRPGAVVVDFGINVLDDGSITGDVDFDSVVEVASAITPVPGGTGPVTNMMLLRNVITATRQQIGALDT
jgi:methylenetetrahydrofolate dehydrogenase (NADP+)/methenyltetrahydrofolate cyclohydrolase